MSASSRAQQWAKLSEIRQALIDSGFSSLDTQAAALGLSRSTTWTILQCKHKNSGLSTSVILRMLARPELPVLVHQRLMEYVDEKIAGRYGDKPNRLRQFHSRLARHQVERRPTVKTARASMMPSPIRRAQ